ncbi:MAG: hypothetical protein JWN98_287 [Abditibacteriota bacterium]|nr:hypothetical protein [Abditibacteriota bacterium]
MTAADRPTSLFARLAPHRAPLLLLLVLCTLYWSPVVLGGKVLLPGEMLRGFAPFGNQATAPWSILQWDALAQYYPWRFFAAQQLQAGQIPLWNPHQFAGAPFVANGQSAVFYPLNLPFWIMDVARAFGVSAWLHSLLAVLSTYFLAQRWKLSRTASLLAAVGFGFCGYLAFWVSLPTLSNTASWLPLLLLLFERALALPSKTWARDTAFLALAIACALLAGHPQIWMFLVLALGLRAVLWPRFIRAVAVLSSAVLGALLMAALQLLPTLELARLGHRAAQGGASEAGWKEVAQRALQPGEWFALFLPNWPLGWGSLNENFGSVGVAIGLLSFVGIVVLVRQSFARSGHTSARDSSEISERAKVLSPALYVFVLSLFGTSWAFATPLFKLFYFSVPGLAQMGGAGRALVLWSFGAALLAAFGFDALRQRVAQSTLSHARLLSLVALAIVIGELWAAGWNVHPTAPRAAVYPPTELTTWLQHNVQEGERVMFLTPRESWLPGEALRDRTHPPGVLPPNGAMVYGLHDVNGYDSLAPLAYRQFVNSGEGRDAAPPLNGNMILLHNMESPALDALSVRYVIALQNEAMTGRAGLARVLSTDGCDVFRREIKDVPRRNGRDFYPGWREGKYQPETFRLGAFLSLCALTLCAAIVAAAQRHRL